MDYVVTMASAVAGVHEWLSWGVVVANGAVGLWALSAHRRRNLRVTALWVLTFLAQASVFLQAGLGSWLIAGEGREVSELHAVYGFSALAAVGIVYSYRQQIPQHIYLLYGATGLFLMGLGIRTMILD